MASGFLCAQVLSRYYLVQDGNHLVGVGNGGCTLPDTRTHASSPPSAAP
jgi:hypothetical protein